MPENVLTTNVSDSDRLNELAIATRTTQASSEQLRRDINEAVGLYLKENADQPKTVDYQREFEELLGSQHAALIQEAQRNFYQQKAQYSVEGTENGKHTEADPVMLFNGQLVHTVTDVRIAGAGIDFVFTRTYKNQAFHQGPLGFNWDHNYNLWLREEPPAIVRSSGELREDRYIKHGTHPFYVSPEGYHDVIEAYGGSFVLRTSGGVRYVYERIPLTNLHRIRTIRDRNNNYLSFTYDSTDRLQRVEINSSRRQVTFQYDTLNRIDAITAYPVTYVKRSAIQPIARVWRYRYDDFGDLTAVTTPTTDDYPSGLTTKYDYSSHSYSGELAHNLLGIYDPAGQLFLENEYGIQKGLLSYNRVTRQRQGGGEYHFEYEDVIPEQSWSYEPEEIPAHRTIFYQRNGHPIEHLYNRFGNLIVKRECIVVECTVRELVSRFRYNRDGALIGSLTPEGTMTQYYYGRDDFYARYPRQGNSALEAWRDPNLTITERLKFGNLLGVVKRGRYFDIAQMNLSRGLYGDFFPSIFATASEDVIVKYTYEPDYQQITSVSDPRYTASIDPRHPEGANQSSAYSKHLTLYEYSSVPQKTLIRVKYPDTAFPSPLPNGSVGLSAIVDSYLQYDSNGRLKRFRDPEGAVTVYQYFRGTQGGDIRDGYLRKQVRDSTALALTTAYEVNEEGRITAMTNPRNIRSFRVVNELGQTSETISGGPGFSTKSSFDRNGLLARQERDNLNDAGKPSSDGNEVRTFRYDGQNNLVQETLGGVDFSKHHVTSHRYDSSDLRVETVLSRGNLVRYTFDERLLPRSTIRGAGSPVASTVKVFHDGDGRKISAVDGRGNLTRFQYDSLNRLVAVIDALGNLRQNEYDKLDNLTLERFFQSRADGAYDLLCRRTSEYDQRGNRIREIVYHFQIPIRTIDPGSAPDAEFNSSMALGLVTPVMTQYFYDRNQRLFRIVNDQNRETIYEYDGAGRRVVERDVLGNYSRTSYDENDNVVRVDRHEAVHDPQTGALQREDIFSTLNEYDKLDRQIATIDGLGNRTTFTYDSLGNLSSVTDPLGNVKRYEYDIYNRKVRDIMEMTATGLGGGPRLPDLATQYDYDENNNHVGIIDAHGTRVSFEIDPLDRPYSTTYPDGTEIRLEYDADDNIIARINNNGLRILYDIDPLRRVLSVKLDSTGLRPGFAYPAGAEDFETYEYDGLGRVLLQQNNFCKVRLRYDSQGRAYHESVQFTTPYPTPRGKLTLLRSFDSLSNRNSLVYANGRKVLYHYDELNRLARIENRTQGSSYPGSAALPMQYDIAHYQYRGLRLGGVAFYNGTGYEADYDGAGRVIRLRHYSMANTLLETQQLYDAANNRRLQRDTPTLPNRINGEAYTYDSLYRLTRYERRAIPPMNPSQFAPPAAALAKNALNAQNAMHQTIGALAQDPLKYTYRYDPLGNRIEERPFNQPPLVYIPNVLNQYQAIGKTGFQFDANGNLIDDGQRLYRYNYRNTLSQVIDKSTGAELLRLLYDASGRSIAVREAGATIHLLYDGVNVIEEYTGGSLTVQYVNENGVDRRCQASQGGLEFWYHQDLLCSIRLLTSAGGQLVARYEYEPFGQLALPVGHSNPYCFAGRRLFHTLNLYDARARQYSPTLGRFLQRDPKGMVDDANQYIYGGNNPKTFIDQMGLEKSGVVSFTEDMTLAQKFSLVDRQYTRALEGVTNKATRDAIHAYYRNENYLLRREASRQGNIEALKFGGAMYAVGTASALGGMAGGYVGIAGAGELGLGTVGTHVLAGGLSGLTSVTASEGTNLLLGKEEVSGEALLWGAGTGMAFGLASGMYQSFSSPRGIPSVIIPERKLSHYFFGKASAKSANAEHNVPRSNQLTLVMKRLGITDTPAGRGLLREHFEGVSSDPSNIPIREYSNKFGTFEAKRSLFQGPSGHFVEFESVWKIQPAAARQFITAMPHGTSPYGWQGIHDP